MPYKGQVTTTTTTAPATAPDRIALVEAACRTLAAADERIPTAAELADEHGVSTDSLRRAFAQVLGVTPRQYADTLRRDRLRDALGAGDDVNRALFSAGYGSPSRLYESVHDHLGMTPASYRAGGAGTTVAFTIADTSLGALLVAATPRGVCKVTIGDDAGVLEAELRREFHSADLDRDDDALGAHVDEVLRRVEGRPEASDVPLDVRGTAFQRRVWEALRRIPRGETRTYGQVAAAIGSPKASRAVGTACATNPVPIVVPCHRVVPASGGVGNYGLGPERKRTLLEREASVTDD